MSKTQDINCDDGNDDSDDDIGDDDDDDDDSNVASCSADSQATERRTLFLSPKATSRDD